MCKPMTDKQLEVAEAILSHGNITIIDDLLKEVRRLRAEAIVWHPWPGEKPPVSGFYLVTASWNAANNPKKKLRETHHDNWDALRNSWAMLPTRITAWAELPAPYGGA